MRQGELRQAPITLNFMPRGNFQTSMEEWGAQVNADCLQKQNVYGGIRMGGIC